MSPADRQLQLAQLALARGMVELSALLECSARADADLVAALIDRGHLNDKKADELSREIAAMDPDELEREVDHGETIVMQTLVENSVHDTKRHLQELTEPLEQADTLATRPEDITTGDDRDSAPDFEELGIVTGGEPTESRYEFVEELGRGGMGQILLAHDQLLDREIALKTLLPDTSVEQPQRRLLAEARLTGQLEHPSVVPVYELGRLTNDEPYYTMRVVPERSLQTILDELKDGTGDPPSLLQLVQMLRQVCLAIEFAHENGVIHRDLKPENILVGNYGEVFVIDWGIAKVLSSISDAPSPTTDVDNQTGSVVGTPQYMAPEQAHGENDAVDERTDIYALGAILYEILTLTPVFSSGTVLGLLMTIVQKQPESPSHRAPDRDIPDALEEICLRALQKDPGDRYQSAGELAEELDLFVEGVKEQERKLEYARELIDRAIEARNDYERARQQLEHQIERRDVLRENIPAWAARDDRVELWECEDRIEQLQIEVERKFGQTVRLFGQSLGHASLDEAHDGLAAMYWQRFVEAENRGDRPMATYFENLVRQHDIGTFTDRLKGHAELSVKVTPADAELTLRRIEEHHRRLVPTETIVTSRGSLDLQRLPHGRYRLEASADGFAPVQMPIKLDRLDSQTIELALHPRDEVPEDFVVIPSGEFLTGPPEELNVDRHRIHLDEYAIQKHPVTCEEYLEFLNDLARCDLDEAGQYAPRTQDDAPSYFPIVDGQFVIPKEDSEGDAWDPQWPICIINYYDAQRFAKWRSQRDGLNYRLPTSLQWEKAARGIDGRLYPWGSHFDPSFCRIRQSVPGKPMPGPVGNPPEDRSPYGVHDMAGNITEWTSTHEKESSNTLIHRGASFNSFPVMCRLDRKLSSPAGYRYTQYGFRLALEFPTL